MVIILNIRSYGITGENVLIIVLSVFITTLSLPALSGTVTILLADRNSNTIFSDS